jgi:hypothetical protein
LFVQIRKSLITVSSRIFAGAIFEGADSRLESVFRQSVDMVNMDKTRLPGTRLEALVARINHRDSFHASKAGEPIHDFLYYRPHDQDLRTGTEDDLSPYH